MPVNSNPGLKVNQGLMSVKIVRKPVNSNPGLKVDQIVTVSSIEILFCSFCLCIGFVIIKLKIEGQTIECVWCHAIKNKIKNHATDKVQKL